jgi:DNA mismatch repair protein MSH5
MGRSLLRTWLLRLGPTLSISVIRSRQDAVACFFLRSENIVTSNAMHNLLKGFKNVPRLLGLMKDGRAKLLDWQGLVKVKAFLYSVMTSLD